MPRGVAQPAALKLISGRGNGTDSGGRKVKAAPGFKRTAPPKPEWLSVEGSAEWDRVLPELMRLELTKELDAGSLAAYCEAVSTLREATLTVQREGLFIDAKQGMLAHPAVGIQRKASADLRAWASHFGLTPTAEQKLKAAEADDGEDNPFD
jgi:P27 family predicted phage terminase small subunit